MRIVRGKLIPRDDGKRIEEVVGLATTGTSSVSVAKMRAPPGWTEPYQTPEFDEVVVVSRGALTLQIGKRIETISAGETGLVPAGKRVQYRNDGARACEYLSVCAPGFRPALAHMEQPPPRNLISMTVGHGRGKHLAAQVETLALGFLDALGLEDCEVSISLVGDRAIRRINRTWRQKDQPTDVLSFPGGEAPPGAPGPRQLGDVIISVDTAERVAGEGGRTVEAEVARYLAHGLLHLLGHDHHQPGEARKMAAAENRLLGAQGMLHTNEGIRPVPKRRRPPA
ncbi:MAG: rRNA maturation RNase YbeY [Myxococcota bacterium]|nr:rRNA maturation RNase YbeY [Myxococcota bacterium]